MSDSGDRSCDSSTEEIPQPPRHCDIPASARRLVTVITTGNPQLSGKRCLIENTDECNDVQHFYCLSRATPKRILDKLEYAWNMKRYTLNLDSRYNIFFLSSKFRSLYDKQRWLLFPETRIIDEYHAAKDKGRENFPKIDETVYRYRLVAHPDMRLVPIHRQASPPPTAPEPPSQTDFTYFPHPYHNFPIIASHLHPRFVICDAGRKLRMGLLLFPYMRQHPSLESEIEKMVEIYNAWTDIDPRNDDAQAFLSSGFSNDGAHDTSSKNNVNHRVRGTRDRWDLTPPRATKRRKLMDEEALRRALDVKKQVISGWLDGVAKEREVGGREYPMGETDLTQHGGDVAYL
ncbi:hypothetical protein LshimejAT787_0211840 [Lyophyllum shimeji]|uniref:HNH nuclease domain-containing protein n=1 Tax=Lyophyllum shimeji TaxID=47721 RepID=A0A9P3UIJ6_LYOSH|nr:hypothetical protein LshimejAT787_0211840 [Lyophyllum shimeji]